MLLDTLHRSALITSTTHHSTLCFHRDFPSFHHPLVTLHAQAPHKKCAITNQQNLHHIESSHHTPSSETTQESWQRMCNQHMTILLTSQNWIQRVQPWESDLWDIIIIRRVLIRIAGLMLCISMRRATDLVSRWIRINRSIKSEPHGVSLFRQKQRGVSITEYHGTELTRVYINWQWSVQLESCT